MTIWYILRDDRACSDDAIVTYCNATENDATRADKTFFSNGNGAACSDGTPTPSDFFIVTVPFWIINESAWSDDGVFTYSDAIATY